MLFSMPQSVKYGGNITYEKYHMENILPFKLLVGNMYLCWQVVAMAFKTYKMVR